MAVYFLRSKHLSRGKGARVTRAAAYRAGERIRDERTSEVYDHSARSDVAYKEVVLPADLTGRADMAWTQDRAVLWNAAEHAGLRRNSRLAREFLVLLPPELTPERRTQLVRKFATELTDKYRCAIDMSIHQPRARADRRNYHAHLLTTTREVAPDGLGRRTTLELGGRERYLLGIATSTKEQYLSIRERWAQLTNEALQHAGLTVRVDHRSLKQQGIDREPTPTIPEKVFYAERRTHAPSAAGDAIRARYSERVEARLKGGDELARVLERQKTQIKECALADFRLREAQPKRIRWSQLTREERNEKRREEYQARFAMEKLDPAAQAKRREAARAQWQARMRENPEAVRESQRRYKEAHRAEVNRKQREYRKLHAQELNLKRREIRRARAEQESLKQRELKNSPRTADEAARNWKAYRDSRGPEPTADEAARNWKAYRDSHGPGPTADDSARDWLAFRERQRLPELAESTTSRTRERELERDSPDEEDADRKRQRQHDYDYGL